MIWAAIATAIAVALGAGGGPGSTTDIMARWLNEWRKLLRKHVHDDERRAAAEAILDDEFEHLDTYFFAVDLQMRGFYDVHRDYAAKLDDYVPYVDDMMATFAELQHQQVVAFRRMHSTLAADEWDAIQERIGEQIAKRRAKAAKAANTKK